MAGEFIDIPVLDGGTFQGHPTLPEGGKGQGWMAFLTAYVPPPHHYDKAGKESSEKQPIDSGLYRVEKFKRGSFVRLEANPDYRGGPPAFDTVVFKFVTDPATLITEIESGRSDLTLYSRLGTRDVRRQAMDSRQEPPKLGCDRVSSTFEMSTLVALNATDTRQIRVRSRARVRTTG